MRNEQHSSENSIARLVGAALGNAARPDPLAKQRTWQRLVAQLRAEQKPVTFPDAILVTLAAILALMALWLADQTLGAAVPVRMPPPLIAIALLLTLNITSVPIAAIVIVMRRRHA